MGSNQAHRRTDMGDQDLYIHLKEISVEFTQERPSSIIELVLHDPGVVYKRSSQFMKGNLIYWQNLDTYVKVYAHAMLTILQAPLYIIVARVEIEFKPNEFGDYRAIELRDTDGRVAVNLVCGKSESLKDLTWVLAPRFLQLPQAAALRLLRSKQGFNLRGPAIHWLKDDILLGIFDCYRHDEYLWNDRPLWFKLSHVCQKWRRVIYDCAFHLGIEIKCTIGSPMVDTLNHLPPLPISVYYSHSMSLTGEEESSIYRTLQFYDRVRFIELDLPPSILHKAVMLMDQPFPILERLSLMSTSTHMDDLPLTLPEGFLAPNLRHLYLPSISPPRILPLLTSPAILITLELNNIQVSSYFQPRLLVAQLSSLTLLEELSIRFSIPIPRPSTERELLSGQQTSVTLPRLKRLDLKGVGAYLESLVAQIRAPLLEKLCIALFNQVAFMLPHLSHLINSTEAFKFTEASFTFRHEKNVCVALQNYYPRHRSVELLVICKPFDWQIDCAVQICHELVPALSCVETLSLRYGGGYSEIPTEFQNGAIDSGMWHDLLRPFTGVKALPFNDKLLEELSRALEVDGVGSDPGFLPNLRSIYAQCNMFTLFINARIVVGRPVQFRAADYYD